VEYIKIKIDTDYKDYTDELEELTKDLKNEIEENEELYIEEVQIPTKPAEKDSKGIDVLELGKLVIPIALNPSVVIALIKVINIWVLARKDITIVKKVVFHYKGKKNEIHGYSKDELIKIIQEIKKR